MHLKKRQKKEEYHFLALQERCMPSALKENTEKYWNQSWKLASVVFVPVAVQRTKFSLRGKSLRSPGSMQRMPSHALLI